jgi:LCP family protein required for cell wall assembly
MYETSGQNSPADTAYFADPGSAAPQPPGRPTRTRRKLRIVLVSLAAGVVFLGAVAVGAYVYVNHVASGIHRVRVALPYVPGGKSGETVLITSTAQAGTSGLIMLLHLNAYGKGGGVVSIPPDTLVQVPGHGLKQIETAPGYGGPSELVKTVEQLTHVQIDHYAGIKFTAVSNLIDVVGGVNVTLTKKTVSAGYTFQAGVNHLTGVTAPYYVRDPSFSPHSRVLLQQSLLRAILDRISGGHMLANPLTAVHVINAVAAMLTVDSNFTNSGVEKLAVALGRLGGSTGTFVTAPTYTVSGQVHLHPAMSSQLWTAIRKNSIAAFAAKYPATVTPAAPS